MPLPKLIVVLGTTACGKSGLGVELARRFDAQAVWVFPDGSMEVTESLTAQMKVLGGATAAREA